VKVELIHPIDADGKLYGRGVHDVDEALAKRLLEFEHAARPYAPPEEKPGTVTATAPPPARPGPVRVGKETPK